MTGQLCPRCNSDKIHSNGIRAGKQRLRCNDCGASFTVDITGHISALMGKPGGGYEHIRPGGGMQFEFTRPVRIHGLTDIHHGAIEHHWEKLDLAIKEIRSDRNARWFGNGDLLELIPPHYHISQRGQEMEPDDQVISFCDRIKPILSKCLFIRGGNHDYLRSTKLLGIDVVRLMAERLGVPYFELPGYATIVIDGKKWQLVTGHGKSTAKNGDLELDRLRNVYTEGDVYYLGHNHQLYVKPIDGLEIRDGGEHLHRQWYIRGGKFP